MLNKKQPLTDDLALAFMDKNVIRKNTLVDIIYTFTDLVHMECKIRKKLQVHKIGYTEKKKLVYQVVDPFDQAFQITITSDEIIEIDGTKITRLATAYNLTFDGKKKFLGKKRGRPRLNPLFQNKKGLRKTKSKKKKAKAKL